MTEVYVVLEHWYEDDEVRGVFSTQKKVDEFMLAGPCLRDFVSVEIWDLDGTGGMAKG